MRKDKLNIVGWILIVMLLNVIMKDAIQNVFQKIEKCNENIYGVNFSL